MADGDLVFMPGDTIEFAVELEHDFNIGDAWAVFRRRQEREGEAPVPLVLDVVSVEEVRRTGTDMLSKMVFEVELTEENQVPGDYDLELIRALPPGYQRSGNKPGIELGSAEVSLRIEKPPLNPTVSLRHWGLGHGRDSRRYPG